MDRDLFAGAGICNCRVSAPSGVKNGVEIQTSWEVRTPTSGQAEIYRRDVPLSSALQDKQAFMW